MHGSIEPGNKNNIPKRIMQQEEDPRCTEVPRRRSLVCLCVSPPAFCASPRAREDEHVYTNSHVISAGSPQQHIARIFLHISKEHNVLLLFLRDINQGERLLLFFSTFSNPPSSLFILPDSITPASLLNRYYFQTPPSVIISFPSLPICSPPPSPPRLFIISSSLAVIPLSLLII